MVPLKITPKKIRNLNVNLSKLKYKALLCALMVGLFSCKQPNDTKWQFAPDMADSPVPKAQFAPLDPPDHSVSQDAFLYAENEIEAEKLINNPYRWVLSSDSSERALTLLTQGKELYETFCQHCHGPQGRGEGTMTDVFPRAPDLTIEGYRKREHGFFFHKITFGGNLMPSLGHALSHDERHKIVLYLRILMTKRIEEEKESETPTQPLEEN